MFYWLHFQLLELSDQGMNSDHMYGVKGSMSKTKMTAVTADSATPGNKDVVVVTSKSGSGDTPPPSKKSKN